MKEFLFLFFFLRHPPKIGFFLWLCSLARECCLHNSIKYKIISSKLLQRKALPKLDPQDRWKIWVFTGWNIELQWKFQHSEEDSRKEGPGEQNEVTLQQRGQRKRKSLLSAPLCAFPSSAGKGTALYSSPRSTPPVGDGRFPLYKILTQVCSNTISQANPILTLLLWGTKTKRYRQPTAKPDSTLAPFTYTTQLNLKTT